MSEQRETRLLMISPNSKCTPDQLAREVHTMVAGLNVKETCYGCIAEGTRAVIAELMPKVRAKYRNEVFSKRRGFPAGDPRRCRAQHGSRPGFAQLEAEWECLPLIQYALDCIDAGDTDYVKPVVRKPLPVTELKDICEAFR